jgi:hypothetical protein
VCALGLVELERTRERLQNVFGDSARVAPLEARVVVSLRVFLCIAGWLGVVGDAVSEVDA